MDKNNTNSDSRRSVDDQNNKGCGYVNTPKTPTS